MTGPPRLRRPEKGPEKTRNLEEFLECVSEKLENTRPVNVEKATRVVFHVLSCHIDRGQTQKLREALPEEIRRLWPEAFLEEAPSRRAAG